MLIYHIQPGCPTQNTFIERFNRTYRNKVFDLYLFCSLAQVREFPAEWMPIYNEHWPHRPCKEPPRVRLTNPHQKTLLRKCPLDGEAYTFTSRLLANGHSTMVTKKLTRHKTIEIVEDYAAWVDGQLQDVLESRFPKKPTKKKIKNRNH